VERELQSWQWQGRFEFVINLVRLSLPVMVSFPAIRLTLVLTLRVVYCTYLCFSLSCFPRSVFDSRRSFCCFHLYIFALHRVLPVTLTPRHSLPSIYKKRILQHSESQIGRTQCRKMRPGSNMNGQAFVRVITWPRSSK
jgi:hypothetical protein